MTIILTEDELEELTDSGRVWITMPDGQRVVIKMEDEP